MRRRNGVCGEVVERGGWQTKAKDFSGHQPGWYTNYRINNQKDNRAPDPDWFESP